MEKLKRHTLNGSSLEWVLASDVEALIAAKREDEARIAELTQCDPAWYDASPSDAFALLTKAKSELTAEQQAHTETKAILQAMDETFGSPERNSFTREDWVVFVASVARRQASINRPTDNSPTDDRGEREKA